MGFLPALLLLEAAAYALAALVHFGFLVTGYQHAQARIAETIISITLLAGFAAAIYRPAWARSVALVAQGLALAGTFVGVFTIVIGIGPRTIPDVVYHAAIVAVLVWGLIVASRTTTEAGAAA
jgi:hypothetical protein